MLLTLTLIDCLGRRSGMVDGIIIIVTTIILIINLLQRQDEASEEWVGTVMGYLTSVELGGHTVFPRYVTVIYQC